MKFIAKLNVIIIMSFFFSCNNPSVIQSDQDYLILKESKYGFTNGMKTTASVISIIYNYGCLSGLIINKTFYQYNQKGQLIKETNNYDSSMQLYSYNANDSLISGLTINNEGDTIFWEECDYYADGRKIKFRRLLNSNLNETEYEYRKITYDTLYEKFEYIYENGLCKTLKKYDKNDILVEQIVYSFENSIKNKVIFYEYSDTLRYIKKIIFYDYSKSNSFPDFYSLDTQNDTIEKCRNTFNNDNLVSTTQYFDYDDICLSTIFINGKITKNVFVDNKQKIKRTEYNTYYPDGNEKHGLIITKAIIED